MQTIATAYYHSPIGLIKVSGTDNYISEVMFADEAVPTQSSLDCAPLLHDCIEQLIEYFNGKRRIFNIPVHQKGTSFQTAVWNELLNIDCGKTISYLALAKKLGNANSVRAAAASNGKNKICIVVPCHRVVGSNQLLVGYVGGLWRKRWLLEHENKIANGVQTLF